ncbi:MAG: hypothetical protein ABSB70_02450 [Candidatus Velthaea sp.]
MAKTKHDNSAIAMNSGPQGDEYLPCGCAAYPSDGNPNAVHDAGCKMNRTFKDNKSAVRQRPAVIAMYAQLNELWYLSHGRATPGDTKPCDHL